MHDREQPEDPRAAPEIVPEIAPEAAQEAPRSSLLGRTLLRFILLLLAGFVGLFLINQYQKGQMGQGNAWRESGLTAEGQSGILSQ